MTGDALSIVKKYGSDDGERSMKNIIESLWRDLDRLFLPRVKPSEDLLNELMTYPMDSYDNRHRLKDFSQNCSRLLDFVTENLELGPVYDTSSTITAFGRHLDFALFKEWTYEKQKVNQLKGRVSLRDFTDWIWGSVLEKAGR